MAVAPRKKVAVQYRKLDDLIGAFAPYTLQRALSKALMVNGSPTSIGSSVSQRHYDIDKSYGIMGLNYYHDTEDYLFGKIVRFEPGADMPLLAMGANPAVYNLTQSKAPAGHEPIRGILYFMAIENHVSLLEMDVGANRGETYLSWLLGEKSNVLAASTQVVLAANLSARAGGKQLTEIREVVFRPRPVADADVTPTTQDVVVGAKSREVSEANTLAVLKAAGMGEADIQEMAKGSGSIEVVLQIKFKDSRRRKNVGIEQANRLLRNLPDDQVTLIGPGGRQTDGRIVKLVYPAHIETTGSLLNTNDVARALHEAYNYFLTNGLIE